MSFSEEITIHSLVDSIYDQTFTMTVQSHFPLEIIYCTDGAIRLDYVNAKSANDSAVLTAGQFLLIKPKLVHIMRILQPTKLYVLEIAHNGKDDLLPYIKNSHFAQRLPTLRTFYSSINDVTVLYDVTCVGRTLKELIALSYKKRNNEVDEFYRYDYDVLLKKLFIEVCRCAGHTEKAHGNKYVTLAMNYIYANYNKTLTLEQIAAFTNVSPGYLQILFKEAYNDTVFAKLIAYRMQKAQELLVQTDYSIATIAKNVGYSNFRAFLSAFTKHVGMSPSEYRKEKRIDGFIHDFGSNTTTDHIVNWVNNLPPPPKKNRK